MTKQITHHCEECGEEVKEFCAAHPNSMVLSILSEKKNEALPLQSEFDTYEAAKAYAVHQAKAMNIAFGIEKPGAGLPEKYRKRMPAHMLKWTVKMIPAKQFRRGFELRCEAVEPPGVW